MKLIEEFEKSGSSLDDFAARLGVKPSTLQFRFYKLRKQASQAPRFLPVDVVASAAPRRGKPIDYVQNDAGSSRSLPGTSSFPTPWFWAMIAVRRLGGRTYGNPTTESTARA